MLKDMYYNSYLYTAKTFRDAVLYSERLNQSSHLVDTNSGKLWSYRTNKSLDKEDLVLCNFKDWSEIYPEYKNIIKYYVVSDFGDIGVCDNRENMEWILLADNSTV